uniref:Uncharacterized protein n=1 Tax=Rhizophora mucronata TaxID=61149 RepID=A0A2P2PCX2_RHIMU
MIGDKISFQWMLLQSNVHTNPKGATQAYI